jgi:hypothetical protein
VIPLFSSTACPIVVGAIRAPKVTVLIEPASGVTVIVDVKVDGMRRRPLGPRR